MILVIPGETRDSAYTLLHDSLVSASAGVSPWFSVAGADVGGPAKPADRPSIQSFRTHFDK